MFKYTKVSEYRMKESLDYPNDPALRDAVLRYGEELGDHGRVTLKFVGIDRKVQILMEADSEELLSEIEGAFQRLLEEVE